MFNKILIAVFCVLACACAGQDLRGNPHAVMCIQDGFTPEEEQSILDGMQEWRDKTTGGIAPTLIHGTSDSCEVKIVPIPHGVEPGDTDQDFNCGRVLPDGSEIQLDVNVPDWYTAALPNHFYNTVLHEAGHYFTGSAHSTNAADVMYSEQQPGVDHLTARDVARFHAQ